MEEVRFYRPTLNAGQMSLVERKVSVRLSVRQMHELWQTEEKSVQIFILYERSFSRILWEKQWLVGATPSTWNFGSSPILNRYSLAAPRAVTPSEKVQLTLIGSPLAYALSNEPKMNIVHCLYAPKGWLKMQSVQNLNNRPNCDLKRYEIWCQLLLIINRKSHMGF